MPFYTKGPDVLSSVQNEGAAGQQSSLGDSLKASFMSGVQAIPIVRINRALYHGIENTEGDQLNPEDANAQYGIKGALSFDKPVSSKYADTLHREKQSELMRETTIRNGPSGVVSAVANMAAGALPSFLDPVNAASMLVPGLGETRVSTGLGMAAARAEGWGMEGAADGLLSAEGAHRSVVNALEASPIGRVVQGASQGMAGQTALEPLNLYLDRDEHNDWTMGQALTNIAFGGLMGGAMHGISHAVTDRFQPEEAPPNTTQERLNGINPDVRGQVLAESLVSLSNDRPSNADSLLHLHELDQTRRDLQSWMDTHGGNDGGNNDTPAPPGRGTLEQDLADLHKKHSALLQEENTPEPQASPDTSTDNRRPARSNQAASPSLFTFLTKHGGVRDEGGELKANDLHKQRVGLVRRNGGLPLDRARELAEEAGYLKPGADINDLLNAMTEEGHGRKAYADGLGPEQSTHLDDPDREEHARSAAHDDVELAAYDHDIPLTPDLHAQAAEATLGGADPHDALEDALKHSSYTDWQQYQESFDKSRAVQQERRNAKKHALQALTEHHLGRYGQRLDAGVTSDDLTSMTDALLNSTNPEEVIEHALSHLESNQGKGFDPRWEDTLHDSYQQALQKLSDLQEGVGSDILRALTNPESREVADNRAGLVAKKEGAPTPERSTRFSPLPTTGIDHLNLSEVGGHPALMGHMPEGIEGVPPWPVVLGDGEHTVKLDAKGRDIGGGHGRAHIMARHGDEIKKRGFEGADDYIRHVIQNINQLRKDNNNGSLFSVIMGERQTANAKHDTAILHVKREDGYYRVATASTFKTNSLTKKELLWEGRRTTPSGLNGHDHPLFDPREHMPDVPRRGATVEATSSSKNSDSQSPKSQDNSLHEAQAYGAQLDQQIALYGDKTISPEELEEVKRAQALSDGNADALSSAAACLTRTVR
ncbi:MULTISPECIES: hypothetical protein [unclassified Saccharibacter]|uniref:hypothetical protein n=1 Tax=unclassified Saccharibacter TaxID=2648722 RepID=UPI0013245A1A|nr:MULTISPECIES: hypothetical protein [unclassified Saccharibacter]MXV35874.1 hypothetical protein [Saccharibacter sp. EH611]MXV57994.1 hypothetical protein [Saccharibacter sp. EH70]MXV66389.1 hypothetical protein [Saccharibacter sp. EH60]